MTSWHSKHSKHSKHLLAESISISATVPNGPGAVWKCQPVGVWFHASLCPQEVSSAFWRRRTWGDVVSKKCRTEFGDLIDLHLTSTNRWQPRNSFSSGFCCIRVITLNWFLHKSPETSSLFPSILWEIAQKTRSSPPSKELFHLQ